MFWSIFRNSSAEVICIILDMVHGETPWRAPEKGSGGLVVRPSGLGEGCLQGHLGEP